MGAGKEAWPGHGRVGHRAQELGEVVLPVARIRVRPCVVEHELPVRVVLEVAGCGGDEAVAFPQRQVAWRPAPRFADAVVAFEAIEESMRDEGIAAVVQRVPILRFDEAERVNQLVAQWPGFRSEERRVGKEGVSTCRSGWWAGQ